MKKLFFLFTILFLFKGALSAQELKFRVAECYQDQQDMAAQNEKRDDGDGHLYAIIKVTSDLEDDDLNSFQFDFNNMRHEHEMRDGELWLFVQYNAKNVKIRREGYKTLPYALPFTVKAGATYRMLLSVQEKRVVQRILQFKVTDNSGNLITSDKPIVKVKSAESTDNYEWWGEVDNNGTIDQLKETGLYLYEISAKNYKTAIGRVSLVNGDGNHVETVKLTPNFGYLEIGDEYGISGAQVYINNARVGTVPYKSGAMECRDDYQLTITNGELYKSYNAVFQIRQGQTTKLTPRLESNFAETTIRVDGDAEIYVNGVRKGHGTWTGPLKAGIYDVECRLTNHVTSKKQITVKANDASTFIIDKPKPIEGSLYVTSSPSGALIYVDGKNVGHTPSKIDHVLIGSHKITIRMANHRDEVRNVNIREGETQTVSVTLSDIARMTINSNPSHADLYINGKYKGTTPYTEEMPSGEYDIKLEKKRCHTYHKRVHLDGSNPERTFKLPIQYQRKHQFYMQPTVQVGQNTSAGMGVGCFVGNFNMEYDYVCGLTKESIYWNYVGTNSYMSDRPKKEKLRSMYYGGKVGYGIILGNKFRITPQFGAGVLRIAGYTTSINTIDMSGGVRVDYAFSRHLGLVLAPEYDVPIAKSEIYKALTETSSKLKGWGQGFNLRVGLNIFF